LIKVSLKAGVYMLLKAGKENALYKLIKNHLFCKRRIKELPLDTAISCKQARSAPNQE